MSFLNPKSFSTKMTLIELKQYISENGNNDDNFTEVLTELLQRNSNPVIYSQDIPLEEQERIFMEKTAKH